MTSTPQVSIVVPTYQRPTLVGRAVHSVLDQTFGDFELIVVVDGRDQHTTTALAAIGDPRIVVHVPDRHLGNAGARNAGVALARARWVAFLDDDDTWLPEKLARQMSIADGASPCARPIVTCHVTARSDEGDMVWPRRRPRAGEDLSEYFFCRRTPFTGEGMVITSSLLTTRELLLDVPFAAGLARHVDPDWLLRATRAPGTCLEFVPGSDPLVVWHIEQGRPRITTQPDWTASLDWCRTERALFSDRGYGAFILHVVGSNAAAQGAWRAFVPLLREAFRDGAPAPVDVASHVANFAVSAPVKRRVAAWFARWTR